MEERKTVMEAESAGKTLERRDAVGKTFRTTIYGDTDLYTVVGVYKGDERVSETADGRFQRYRVRIHSVHVAHLAE